MNTVCCFDKISEKIKQVFGRDTKYQKVVAAAREAAKENNLETVVYQQGKTYHWNWSYCFSVILEDSHQPVIKLLICLPDGTVAQ